MSHLHDISVKKILEILKNKSVISRSFCRNVWNVTCLGRLLYIQLMAFPIIRAWNALRAITVISAKSWPHCRRSIMKKIDNPNNGQKSGNWIFRYDSRRLGNVAAKRNFTSSSLRKVSLASFDLLARCAWKISCLRRFYTFEAQAEMMKILKFVSSTFTWNPAKLIASDGALIKRGWTWRLPKEKW